MASVAQRAAVSASSVSQIASSARNASSRPTATCHVASLRVHLGSDFVSKSASSAFQGVRITLAKSQSSRNSRSASRAVVVAAGGSAKLPSMNELPLLSYINQQGRIVPPVDPGTTASVFAVLDKNKKVQYIGFSKDVRNSLRTLMGRRPEFCYYYKLYNLSTMDQQQMIDIRAQWFSEMGIPPLGNTDPIQRGYWERPADAGSISERGKVAAAQSKAKTLLQMMADRGLKEEMEYDPKLIEEGKCDVLPVCLLTRTHCHPLTHLHSPSPTHSLSLLLALSLTTSLHSLTHSLTRSSSLLRDQGLSTRTIACRRCFRARLATSNCLTSIPHLNAVPRQSFHALLHCTQFSILSMVYVSMRTLPPFPLPPPLLPSLLHCTQFSILSMSKSQSAEELAAAAAEQEASAARVVHITETAPSGEVIEFDLTTDNKIKTNGGWMYDIYVTKDDKETRHRIVLGRVYSEAVNLPEDAVISRIIAFLLHKKIPRQTEGVLSSEQFPINYFAVSEVAQKFEDLGEWFPGGDLPDSYWRFNRIHEYGNVTAPVSTQEAPQLYSPKY
ncbi:unnamed protein product [Closterium sp. NIES-54]